MNLRIGRINVTGEIPSISAMVNAFYKYLAGKIICSSVVNSGKMVWNEVVSGFDKEEETVNFGKRIVAENNGSLYEASTIAAVHSFKKVVEKPNVSASVQYSRVCIAIDSSIVVFEDKTCEKTLVTASFDFLITNYCVSPDGFFVFLVLSNGFLYCFAHLIKGHTIFTKEVAKDGNDVVSIFLQDEPGECTSIYLIMKNGAIYKVTQFKSKFIRSVVMDSTDINDLLVHKLGAEVDCEQIFKGFSCNEVIYATAGMIGTEMSIAMLCPNMIFMWPSEQCNNFNTPDCSYTKVKFFRNNIAMLCLRKDSMLSMICPQTLLGIKVYSKPVSDFTIIENNDNSSCEILVLTPHTDCTMRTLHVFSFPDFQEKFQITVPIMTYLVELTDPCDEIILYLEGVNDFNNDPGFINTVRVKTVSESMPKYQLQRLIRKEQFDAAETFASKFDLSKEPIYCAKVALILSQLGPWAVKSTDSIELDVLLNIFDKIENVQYVVECCSKALIPNYKQMRKIHLYARSRVLKNAAKDDKCLNLLSLSNDILHKLETFHMIWGYKQNLEYYDNDTMKEWIRFSRANFMEEYKQHLSLGEMEAATLIWMRHLPNIVKYVSMETVKDIFAILPEKISPSALWPWLSHFIPSLLSLIPSAMCEIVLWAGKKIKSFEQSHCSEWPQIGIDFTKKFIELLKFEEGHQSLYFQQECLNKDSNLKQLVFLIQAISDIQKLKVHHRLKISLDSYIGDPVEVSHMLLDKVHATIIPEFVNTFLKQYMMNNFLQNDYVFSSYIQKTLRNSKSWWSGEEAPWEIKVVVIIDLIQNIETKLQQVLEILKRASVPWSSTIKTLAETSSNFDHILTNQIRIECNCVPIKLVLKKYGYERIGINNKLIHRIIKENQDSMISDIQQITKNDLLLRKKAFSRCTNYYLSRGNFENVMKILNSLENDVLFYCCIQIVNYVTASLTLKTIPESLTYYIEMLGWVKLQLEKLSRECKTQLYHCNDVISSVDEIKSMYLLKKEFEIDVTQRKYQIKKEQILQNYIERLKDADLEKDENLCIMYKKCIKVADLLKLQRIDVIYSLLKYTKNVDFLNYFTGHEEGQLTLTADECKYVYKICLLVMQHAKKGADIAVAIQNLSSAALCACSNDELQSMLLLFNWANLYRQCSNKNLSSNSNSVDIKHDEIPRTGWKLYTIYKDLTITADVFLLPLFRDVISVENFYMRKSKLDSQCVTADEVVQNCNSSNAEEPLKEMLDKMKKLKVEHNDYSLSQILKTLYFSSYIMSHTSDTLLIEMKLVYFHILTTLLKKVISSRTFDLQLSLSCLFILPDSEASKWISATYKAFQSDCTRHLRITILGYEYFLLTKNESSLQIFDNNKMLHCWAQKLSEYSVSYKEILTSDATTKREVLQRIMSYNDDMIPLFHAFCFDFGFDIQDCLLLYLQIVIKTWNPKLNIKNYNGKKELHINEEEVRELRIKCDGIVAHIPDKVAVKNCITTIFSQINFYHYEIFIILMDLIEDKNIKHRNYFCFLQNYTRNSQPTQIECDAWMHLNPGYTSLPPIAEWRLPFLPKVELWKLITPELNLKSYEKWLDIAPILKLQSHIICTLAIKGEVTHAWRNKLKMSEWSLCPKNSTLLSDIKKCIEKLTGPDSLYYGTAALYYVVNHTPPGADQVAAVEECYKYAQLSAQKSTTFEEGMLEKIKFKYLRFTSEHILHTHGLGNNNYVSLIGNPNKLIRELYADESIPQRYRCVIDHRPDINSAVNSICQLFSINLVKLRMELLHEWLQPDVKDIKFNQSVTETFTVTTNLESNLNCDDNLLRACYILEHGDIELSANFLINIGFGEGSEDYSLEARYRALHVLQTIVDTAKLEDLTKRDCKTIRKYMRSLKYISKLDLLGIGYSIRAFETCSKPELVQILWKTQSYSPQALVVIAQLCIDFEIYDYSLWDQNLTKLSKLLMINELKGILLQVRNIGVIINSNGYLLGWEVVISEPFRKMDTYPTPEQIENCIETLQLLYSCPIIHMLNFNEIVKYCFRCRQPHLALALLPFLNDDDTNVVLEKIKHATEIAKILEDLNNLLSNGILCVDYCNKIIKSIPI